MLELVAEGHSAGNDADARGSYHIDGLCEAAAAESTTLKERFCEEAAAAKTRPLDSGIARDLQWWICFAASPSPAQPSQLVI
jgi:hypothetical protein